jgi:hypothetical protein
MGASIGARGMLWSKWSPEKEKNKLVRRRRKNAEKDKKGRNLPRGNRPLFLWERHANLLPLHCLDWFRLGLNSTFPADA